MRLESGHPFGADRATHKLPGEGGLQAGIGATRNPRSGEHGENPPFDVDETGGTLAQKRIVVRWLLAFWLLDGWRLYICQMATRGLS